jgi:diguanylate cyclase (GGDEF)-like protein
MTGLLNREAFVMSATAAINDGAGISVLIADMDRFKWINDTWGHEAGDLAIKQVAETIRKTAGDSAQVGRIGGEEFAVLLIESGALRADRVAHEIRTAIEALRFHPVEGTHHALSISVGGAQAWRGAGISEVLRIADRNLYRAKGAGRNRVMFEVA